ncbi:acyl-CoA dehydrogenase family protein [Nocardioides lijunqiniae]|uniref:acyl-CoA dehydrogenase family protein n=1 Tax=Nocardioides lijunqiniae TaxID=2760832 RepID=UPI001D0C7678|nr:acyl-CoA dehydrogenase family protein [Nocardioides lijunqiniae]
MRLDFPDHPSTDVDPRLEALPAAAAAAADGGVPAAIELARELGAWLPAPGKDTRLRWEALATVAAVDLSVTRVVEPHLDALAILDEAGLSDGFSAPTWGVYAAEGPGMRVVATAGPGGVQLSGTKPWCSLAGSLDRALVTAWVDDSRRGLFAIDLRHPGVRTVEEPWVGLGLRDVTSGPIELDAVPAQEVGGPGWYLERDGFAWGGIGVAAAWLGGAVGVARRMFEQVAHRAPDQIALAHLGAVDARLAAAAALLGRTADQVDGGSLAGDAAGLAALRVRQVVADAVDDVLTRAAHSLGPAPLAKEHEHAHRVADLQLYVRQHHAERDAAALGAQLVRDVT